MCCLESFFFSFIFISWRLITLQHCSGFCHTLKWISHGFTCIPHPSRPSHLPLHPIPLGLPSAPGPSTCLMHPTWAGDQNLLTLFHLYGMLTYYGKRHMWEGVCVPSHFIRHQLCNLMGCSPPGSSVHSILQPRILEWVTMLPPGGLPDPGIKPTLLTFSTLVGGFFTTITTWEAHTWKHCAMNHLF